MAFVTEMVESLPFPAFRRKAERKQRGRERPQSLLSPLEAQQLREAVDMQRTVGVGHWPGMTDAEFQSALMHRIYPIY